VADEGWIHGIAVDGGAPMSSRKDFAILMYQGVELKERMDGASTVRRQKASWWSITTKPNTRNYARMTRSSYAICTLEIYMSRANKKTGLDRGKRGTKKF
jgi:hypothetical protein